MCVSAEAKSLKDKDTVQSLDLTSDVLYLNDLGELKYFSDTIIYIMNVGVSEFGGDMGDQSEPKINFTKLLLHL